MRSVTFTKFEEAAGVPRAEPLENLLALLAGRRFAVLSGAGCSTDSGIPDYRGPQGSLRRRRPIEYQEFLRSEAARRRYWARSTLGFRTLSAARPNIAHHALAGLERAGRITGLITQNVDGLHGAAGSRRLVELHGSIHFVRCLSCGDRSERAALQETLRAQNPTFESALGEVAPDGDAEIEARLYEGFVIPACARCGGLLKPDVVFFGENVTRGVVDAAWQTLADAEALLVVGSSLALYSGLRFPRGAAERGLPIAIVNLGPTRGDELAAVRLNAAVGPVLQALLGGCGDQASADGTASSSTSTTRAK
jgi:NAD-dependent deacetylase sirtuin 4